MHHEVQVLVKNQASEPLEASVRTAAKRMQVKTVAQRMQVETTVLEYCAGEQKKLQSYVCRTTLSRQGRRYWLANNLAIRILPTYHFLVILTTPRALTIPPTIRMAVGITAPETH
jgi:hypothetical protein